jgi:hypothetical protein
MDFSLVPSRPDSIIDAIEGALTLVGNRIDCTWDITGKLGQVLWPPAATSPGRRMQLWEHTCFEFFIGPVDGRDYLEFNLSPAGDWNAFSFTDVRTGMQESDRLRCQTSRLTRAGEHAANLGCEVAFERQSWPTGLRAGVSAVIEGTDKSLHYFALAHTTGRPDFHCRDNHTLIIRA